MTIYNKDGSIYQLSKPNPLMVNQNPVEEDWYILHNQMGGEEIVIEYEQKSKRKPIKKIEPSPPLPVKIELPKEILNTPEVKIEPEILQKKEPIEVEGDLYHCLPAKLVESYDELYDEKIRKIIYGNQFSLELRKYSGGDIGTKLISNQPIDEKSILFSIRDKRWWKVANCIKQNNIFLISVVPSLEQPNFT